MIDAPDELSLAYLHLTIPEDPDFAPEWHGRAAVAVAGMWAGDPAEGEPVIAGLRGLGDPVADLFAVMPYADFQCALDDPPGYRNYWTAEQADDLPDDADRRDRRAVPCAARGSLAAVPRRLGRGAWRRTGGEHSPLGRARRPLRRAPAVAVGGPGRRRAGDRLVARLPRADGARTGPAART